MERTQSFLNQISLKLRHRFWGNWQLRSGLPTVQPQEPARLKERQFYDLVLKRAFSPDEAQRQNLVLDVGCRNWSYLASIADFFQNAQLEGVEIDSLRRYWNLYRRVDYANAYAQAFRKQGRQIECFADDFLKFAWRKAPRGKPPLFCFFFPFVSENPCLQWGLPRQYADFGALVEHASKLANSNYQDAQFFSLHQGEWEGVLARAIYLEQGVEITSEGVISADEFKNFWPSPHDVWFIKGRSTTDLLNGSAHSVKN
ncbi:MAG TPA: hypothetical protein DCS07_05690 [Bdellovibrionales bacterium]|nr:MAG: hypothetical protein A2Z97_16540 [Bdellovibrionales bacterium GWB1_52_6]OFZ02863.1 MAG: hypothetical protein A2X97_04630 [Bdellovibrionales bacterium GWA1_52_35]HAR42111.1 hypothetical protein [Bdellovibrionales bacterium]HCM38444.1 hypothetical protein [Bdellovibrionales bacterium]